MALLRSIAPLVQAQIGLITVDENILNEFEPQAAPPQVRLEQAQELLEAGIATRGRLDPILPGLTDDEPSFRDICSAFSEVGISSLAAGTLFLRPAITSSLRKHLSNDKMQTDLFDAFVGQGRLPIRNGGSSVMSLSQKTRHMIFERLQTVAAEFDLEVRICACKNPDISTGTCHIAGKPIQPDNPVSQMSLF